ncbi:DUF6879 family protein [Nocardiopsis sp. NPDC006198]|uniref:DUF6879 family protein n=1 Tax=Nocardiopsis sp. NPDC006198 TaxID=3154472 RepID=UPI0033B90B3B
MSPEESAAIGRRARVLASLPEHVTWDHVSHLLGETIAGVHDMITKGRLPSPRVMGGLDRRALVEHLNAKHQYVTPLAALHDQARYHGGQWLDSRVYDAHYEHTLQRVRGDVIRLHTRSHIAAEGSMPSLAAWLRGDRQGGARLIADRVPELQRRAELFDARAQRFRQLDVFDTTAPRTPYLEWAVRDHQARTAHARQDIRVAGPKAVEHLTWDRHRPLADVLVCGRRVMYLEEYAPDGRALGAWCVEDPALASVLTDLLTDLLGRSRPIRELSVEVGV